MKLASKRWCRKALAVLGGVEAEKVNAAPAESEPVLEGIRLIGFSQKADRLAFSRAPAQLAERLHGMQEVRGSIPLSSTIFFIVETV